MIRQSAWSVNQNLTTTTNNINWLWMTIQLNKKGLNLLNLSLPISCVMKNIFNKMKKWQQQQTKTFLGIFFVRLKRKWSLLLLLSVAKIDFRTIFSGFFWNPYFLFRTNPESKMSRRKQSKPIRHLDDGTPALNGKK